MLCSDDRARLCWSGTVAEIRRLLPGRVPVPRLLKPAGARKALLTLLAADTAVGGVLFLCTVITEHWWEKPFITALAVTAGVLLLATCLFPTEKASGDAARG